MNLGIEDMGVSTRDFLINYQQALDKVRFSNSFLRED